MNIRSIRLGIGCAFVAAFALAGACATGAVHVPGFDAAPQKPAEPVSYEPIGWVKLMPASWLKRFRELNFGQMSDGDPRVGELLKAVEDTWDTAPTVAELDGRHVKIAGYIVPVEVDPDPEVLPLVVFVPLDDVVVARRNLAHQALLKRWLDQVGRFLLGLSSAFSSLGGPLVIPLQPNTGISPEGLSQLMVTESHHVFADLRIVHRFIEVQMRTVDVAGILVSARD